MKKIVVYVLLQTVLSVSLYARWEVLNEGKSGSFSQIDFVSDDVGWGLFFGNYYQPNLLLKTNDFGSTWSEIDISMLGSMDIMEIDFVSDSAGWILADEYRGNGQASRLYYTDNGGNSWKMLYESSELERLCVPDSNTLFVVTNGSEILKIMNNEVFEILPNFSLTNRLVGMWFKDSNVGFVTDSEYVANGENYLYATTDGGNAWTKKSMSFYEMRNLQFWGDSLISFMGDGLYKSTDTLQTWSKVSQMELDLANYQMISPDSIFLITRDDILLSIDGGATSEVVPDLSLGMDDSPIIHFNSRNEGYFTTPTCMSGVAHGACLTGRMDFRSEDGGTSWTLSELSYPFREAYFLDENIGFTVGGNYAGYGAGNGHLFMTTNGGRNWEVRLNTKINPIQSIQFVNEKTAFIMVEGVFEEPYIYKTIDGGISWQGLSGIGIDFDSRFGAVHFIDENTGWLVYDADAAEIIMQTTNSAQSWEKVWQKTKSTENYSEYSFHFSNSEGWLVSTSGFIANYTEENQWQTIKTLSGRLEKVFFTDTNNGWILSYPEDDWWNELPILLKTQDGGENWESQPMNYPICDIYFEDKLNGWGVGADTTDNPPHWFDLGIILHTTDGGLTWDVTKDKISAELTDIHYNDGYLWAVGNNGLVLKTAGKVTGVEDTTNDNAPNAFILSQNYPNPFNPTTTIRYELSKSSSVQIAVYNITGQQVRVLVNETTAVGSHTVQWDGKNDSGMEVTSGQYFYQLHLGDFISTRKMLVIK